MARVAGRGLNIQIDIHVFAFGEPLVEYRSHRIRRADDQQLRPGKVQRRNDVARLVWIARRDRIQLVVVEQRRERGDRTC